MSVTWTYKALQGHTPGMFKALLQKQAIILVRRQWQAQVAATVTPVAENIKQDNHTTINLDSSELFLNHGISLFRP